MSLFIVGFLLGLGSAFLIIELLVRKFDKINPWKEAK